MKLKYWTDDPQPDNFRVFDDVEEVSFIDAQVDKKADETWIELRMHVPGRPPVKLRVTDFRVLDE